MEKSEAPAGSAPTPGTWRIAQFNLRELSTDKIVATSHPQVDAAAKIVARFHPDVVCLNEMQFDIANVPTSGMPGAKSAKPGTFSTAESNATRIAARIAAENPEAIYPYALITVGNSGFAWSGPRPSTEPGSDWYSLRGWGEYRGRFNTIVLSKFPIVTDQVRIITDVAWDAIPKNSIAQMKTDTGLDVPAGYPVFEKSLNVIPLDIHGKTTYLVMSHPTAPAFWSINPYRHEDELRALALFLDGQLPGVESVPQGSPFVLIGDLNADPEEGDSRPGAIARVLAHDRLEPWFPEGAGTMGKNPTFNTYVSGCGKGDGSSVGDPSSRFQMQIDYILPSKEIGRAQGGAVFFPNRAESQEDFDLACRASDHMFLYVDLPNP